MKKRCAEYGMGRENEMSSVIDEIAWKKPSRYRQSRTAAAFVSPAHASVCARAVGYRVADANLHMALGELITTRKFSRLTSPNPHVN